MPSMMMPMTKIKYMAKKRNSVLDEFSRKLLSRRGVIHGPLTLRDIAGPVYKSAAVKLKNQR